MAKFDATGGIYSVAIGGEKAVEKFASHPEHRLLFPTRRRQVIITLLSSQLYRVRPGEYREEIVVMVAMTNRPARGIVETSVNDERTHPRHYVAQISVTGHHWG